MSGTFYRYEVAKQGRAGCQNSACKSAEIKIAKGELRFGTLVTIQEHTTWKWKHWGCVTPVQIGNIIGQIGGLEGLDLDKDLDILDGYEDLPDWAQDKIKYALENGHVHDDDWKGIPGLNRPGQKGINKRTPKKANKSDDENDSTAVDSPTKPKKSAKKKATKTEDSEDEAPAPKKKPIKKRKAAVIDDDDEEDIPPTKPTKKKSKSKTTAIKDEDLSADEPIPVKKSRIKKVKQESNGNGAIDTKIPQTDGPPEKKRKRTSAAAAAKVKSQDEDAEDAEDDVPLKPTKPAKAKKAKAEPVEDDDVLDDVDKKKQNRSKRGKGRGKGAAAAAVPEDEVTDAPQPVEPEAAAVADGDEVEGKGVSKKKKGTRKSKA